MRAVRRHVLLHRREALRLPGAQTDRVLAQRRLALGRRGLRVRARVQSHGRRVPAGAAGRVLLPERVVPNVPAAQAHVPGGPERAAAVRVRAGLLPAWRRVPAMRAGLVQPRAEPDGVPGVPRLELARAARQHGGDGLRVRRRGVQRGSECGRVRLQPVRGGDREGRAGQRGVRNVRQQHVLQRRGCDGVSELPRAVGGAGGERFSG